MTEHAFRNLRCQIKHFEIHVNAVAKCFKSSNKKYAFSWQVLWKYDFSNQALKKYCFSNRTWRSTDMHFQIEHLHVLTHYIFVFRVLYRKYRHSSLLTFGAIGTKTMLCKYGISRFTHARTCIPKCTVKIDYPTRQWIC